MQNDLPLLLSLLSLIISFKSNVKYIFFSLLQMRHLQNPKLYNIHFFSALTLGLKKEDIVFIPVLSTLARVFWAAVIFLGGWNKGGGESMW